MVRSCCVCKEEKQGEFDGRSFHKFPVNEEEKQAWLEALGKTSAAKTAVICSNHFTENDFSEYGNPERRRLKRGIAIKPSLNLQRNVMVQSRVQPCSYSSTINRTGSIPILQDITNAHDNSDNSRLPTGLSTSLQNDDRVAESLLPDPRIDLGTYINNESKSSSNENVHKATKRLPISTEDRSLLEEPPAKRTKTSDVHDVSVSSVDSFEHHRSEDRSVARIEGNIDDASDKKIRLFIGCKSMSYSRADFINEQKWLFFQEFIKTERQRKKNLQRNYKHSVKTYQDLKSTMKARNCLNESSEEFIKTLPTGVQTLLTSILQGKRYKTYPEELRNFALNLHFYSPNAYTFLNENFGDLLPSLSTLRSYLRQYNFTAGISLEAIASVKRLVEHGRKNEKQIVFNLTCDEMAIRQKIEWDAAAKKPVGFVDYGTSKISIDDQSKESKANSALVFMLVAMNSHFKISIAYYLVKSADGKDKEELLKEVLDACFANDIDIKNVTFDGVSSNISMVENLGADMRKSTSEVYFDYKYAGKTRRIRAMLDSCHALKLVRNILANHDLVDDNGDTISFKYVKALQELQEKEQMHPATKLRKKHIHFKNEIMKVNIAAQTLSSSVAKALDFCREDLGLPQFESSAATSRFCQNVNDSFDLLNSRNVYNKDPRKHAISRSNIEEKEKKVDELVKYFESLTINGTPILNTKQHTGFLGLVTGMRNVIAIAKDLFTTYTNFQFLLTYKLSQDHLETFFSCIRRLGGFNNNPTVRQFRGAHRKLLAHVSISVPLSANCMPRDDTILAKVDVNAIQQDAEVIAINAVELASIFDLLDEVHLSEYVNDVVAYISGSVVRLIKNKISCDICCKQLTATTELDGNGADKVLPVSKLQRRKCYGKLISASSDVIAICRTAERIFRLQITVTEDNVLEKMALKTLHVLPSSIFSDDTDHIFDQEILSDHRTQLIKIIAKKYLEIRLHYAASTDDEKKERIRMRLNKLLLFKGV